jgi:hypothetical protein
MTEYQFITHIKRTRGVNFDEFTTEICDQFGADKIVDEYWPLVPHDEEPYIQALHFYYTAQDKVEMVDGKWKQLYIIREYDDENKAILTGEKKSAVISQRNYGLASTDWTQLNDIPDDVKAKYALYRQQLRDITSQEGFPWTVEFPTLPT